MGPRLIAIACLVVSLLSAPALAWADYRSDHAGVRAGPGTKSAAARRVPTNGHGTSAVPNAERFAVRSPRPNRLPRLVLFGMVIGGAWWVYRKYGRELPRAQLARIGGVAAVGLGLAYVLFTGRSDPHEVVSQHSRLASSRDAVGARTARTSSPYIRSFDNEPRYETNAIPDDESAGASPGTHSNTRRNRIPSTRRGTLYDHSTRYSPPPNVPEPEIPHDPVLIATISPTGRSSPRDTPPALFEDDSAHPIDTKRAQSASPSQKTAPAAATSSVSASQASGQDKPAATGSKATPSAAKPATVKATSGPRTAATFKVPAQSLAMPAADADESAVPVVAAAKNKTTGGTAAAKTNSPSAEKTRSAAKPSTSTPRVSSLPASESDAGVVPAHYQPTPNSEASGSTGGTSGSDSSSSNSGSGQSGSIGIAPPKEVPEFLRQESVLLDPGEYQIEVGFLYTLTQSSSVLQLDTGDATFVGDLERRQRLMLTNLDFRIGVTPKLQASVLIPFGWSSGELVFAGQDQVSSSGGIGDINVSLTRLITEGDANSSQILMNFGMSAPTGESNFVSSVSTPGSQLGQGFYTMTGGITFVRVFDPLVLFGGFGFQHRFDTEVAPNVSLAPGEMAYYRFGLGWAVNTRITLNGSFSGSYLTDIEVNNRRIAGSAREPMSIRLAATIARAKRNSETKPKMRTVEPHLTFGLTESAPAVQMGISWSY